MKLDVLTKQNVELIRQWRNQDIDLLRTPFPLTAEMQEDFYYKVICNREAKDRFWAVIDGDPGCFIGMVGLVDISLENRSGEISIVIDPELRGRGKGKEAVKLLLEEGFFRLNLDNIYGECYKCSEHLRFWISLCEEHKVQIYELPSRKYVNGQEWGSIYFNFKRENMI